MPPKKTRNAGKVGAKNKTDKKDENTDKQDETTDKPKPEKKKKRRGTGVVTVGYTVKAVKGHYYNLVDSLDGLVCPPVPQVQFTGPSRAPREPPCCPPSTCCYPPPYCPQQPGRRCC